jgi:pimeloyl-ACP methyl ester carboxylesterase
LVGAALLNRRDPRAPAEHPVVATPGHRGGSGTPLLLLHGVGGTWRAWTPVLPHLEPHHDVLAPTLLGHGGAARLGPGVAPSIDALVDGVEAELDRAGTGQVHVVGNSLGGWIALELARRGRARSVVLFSPAGAWRSTRRIAAVAGAIRLSVAALARVTAHADAIAYRPGLRWVLMAGQVAHPDRVDPAALAADIRAAADAPVVGPLLRVISSLRLDPLPRGPYPVRVVWAEPDRVIPFEHFGVPMLERVPGAELIRQRGIGHVPMSDEPATVARLILEVTQAVDAAPSDPNGTPTR